MINLQHDSAGVHANMEGEPHSPGLQHLLAFCECTMNRVSDLDPGCKRRSEDKELCHRLNAVVCCACAGSASARDDEHLPLTETGGGRLAQHLLATHMPHFNHLSVRVEDIMASYAHCHDVERAIAVATRCKGIHATLAKLSVLLSTAVASARCTTSSSHPTVRKQDLISALRQRCLFSLTAASVANAIQCNLQMFLCLITLDGSASAPEVLKNERDRINEYLDARTRVMHPEAIKYVQTYFGNVVLRRNAGCGCWQRLLGKCMCCCWSKST